MPTLAEAEAHQQAVTDLTTLAQAELVATWRTLDLANPSEVAAATRDVVPTIVAAYSLASATLAAEFYETVREAAGVPGAFIAELFDQVAPGRIDALIGWGLQPLVVPQAPIVPVAPDPGVTLSRLSGGLQRIVANADRDTIVGNVDRDPADARWARHASANACAFCALMATRDAAYRTETAALRVTEGRSGKRALGEKYHDDCRCTAVPEWPDAPLERAPYVNDWRAAYAAATAELGGANDPKAILALMRQSLGAR